VELEPEYKKLIGVTVSIEELLQWLRKREGELEELKERTASTGKKANFGSQSRAYKDIQNYICGRRVEERKAKPLSEIASLTEAIQESFNSESLREAIGFVCMWEEFRRTGTSVGEPCFGAVVSELLRVNGIDIDTLGRMNRHGWVRGDGSLHSALLKAVDEYGADIDAHGPDAPANRGERSCER